MLLTAGGPVRVTPLKTSAAVFYLSFFNEDRTDGAEDWVHPPDEQIGPSTGPALRSRSVKRGFFQALGFQAGSTLRRYRLAVATTGEYHQARGNTDLDVLASIVAEVNNANAVFEPEVTVRLRLDFVLLNSDPAHLRGAGAGRGAWRLPLDRAPAPLGVDRKSLTRTGASSARRATSGALRAPG